MMKSATILAQANRMLVVVLFAVATTGCCAMRQGRSSDAPFPVASTAVLDTVRGKVSVVGSEPMTEVVLLPVAGGAPVALAGSQRVTLRGLGGVEVMVTGRLTGKMSAAIPRGGAEYEVDSFVVRAVDGVAATDGIVATSDGMFFLVTTDGRRLSADHLPALLKQKVGARVYLAGSLDRAPVSYGVIADRP